MSAAVRYRVLGPAQVQLRDRAVVLGKRQWTLLAVLLLEPGRAVGVDRLVDAFWGDEPPVTARNQVQIVVSTLRRALAEAGAPDIVARVPGGYLLRSHPDETDLYRFECLATAAQDLVRAGDVASARDRLREALGLWRGEAFSGVASPVVEAAATRLGQRRLTVWEECLELELSLGRHQEVVDELAGLVAEHPMRERLRGLLMVALYRCGRQVEALAVFREGRRLLVEQVGVEPGEALAEVHQQILRGDPDLAAAATQPPPAPELTVRPDTLPRVLADFTGRSAETTLLVAALSRDVAATAVAVVDGMAGAGKTALAVRVAHLLADAAPDARLFIDLHGHSPGPDPVPPAAALAALLRQVGVANERVPVGLAERTALWRSELAGRRALVVLDNAFDAAQVAPLLPGGPDCMVLVTARRRLAGLDGAYSVSLDMLPSGDAEDLFATVVGRARVAAEPEAAAEVVRRCGRLPLAVRIAGSRLRHRPTWTVRYLADRLADAHRRLGELAHGGRGVAAAFALSYDQLTAAQQRMFRFFGDHVGDELDVHTAAAGLDLPLAEAEDCLENLVDAHLALSAVPGRYRQHDLLRRYAHDLTGADAEAVREQTTIRILDYYIAVAGQAADLLFPERRRITVDLTHSPAAVPALSGRAAALSWLETERGNLVAAVRVGAGMESPARAWWLTHALWSFYKSTGHIDDWETTHRTTLAACERAAPGTVDDRATAALRTRLGQVLQLAGRHTEAVAEFRTALALRRETGDWFGEASTLNSLGLVHRDLGRYQDALGLMGQAVTLYRELGNDLHLANGLLNVATVYLILGRDDDALRHLETARGLCATSAVAGPMYGNFGEVHLLRGEYAQAITHLRHSVEVLRKINDRRNLGVGLDMLGTAYAGLGQFDTAQDYHEQGLALVSGYGDVDLECKVRNSTGRTLAAAGRFRDAAHQHRGALELAARFSRRRQQALAHEGIGDAVCGEDPEAARRHWEQAYAIYRELELPEADRVAARLG